MDSETNEVGDDVASSPSEKETSLVRLVFSCMVAGGVQYGWALQLSLLTPYVQTLGLSHTMTSLMWLCGPIAGFLVQPCVGLYSDKCRSRFGRRRPFISVGCLIICLAVIIIGFSSDIGYYLGDTKEDCRTYRGSRVKAAIIFVAGFWVLDFSNNVVQGPARALMADLSGRFGCNAANAIFASWMAIGNILGYSSGSTDKWHMWFPFLKTKACCAACANLKGAFLIAVIFLLFCLCVTLVFAQEVPLTSTPGKGDAELHFLDIFKSMKNLPPGMPQVLLVTGLTWLSWFPFILYDTDWMGREVFHGGPKGTQAQIDAFDKGVRSGAFGLLLNSVVLGITSFTIYPLCQKLTARIVWVAGNVMVCIAMVATTLISWWSTKTFTGTIEDAVGADTRVKAVALTLFALLGVPLAILYSVPFAVTATLASSRGGGQGLCTGLLNVSIVIPQVIVALGAGPWDQIFHKGNIPAFAMAAGFAFIGAILGFFMLPKLARSSFKNTSMGGMH